MIDMVYVIGSPEARPVKIGHSTNVAKRLADLQRMCPVPLVVLDQFEGGLQLESALHAHFSAFRSHGEWFDFGSSDPVSLIRSAIPVAVTNYEPSAELKAAIASWERTEAQFVDCRDRLRRAIAQEMLTDANATTGTVAKHVEWSEETLRGIAHEFKVPRRRQPTVRSIKDKPEA